MQSELTRRAALIAAAGTALLSTGAVAQAKSRIGIIGAGNIGASVGGLWVKAGHPVMFSSRNPDELKDLVAKLGPLAHAGTVAQAIAYGDALFIAVPFAALPQIGADYKDALKGKIMLDATNAVPTRDGAAITKEADTNGIGITAQKYLAGTRLVREAQEQRRSDREASEGHGGSPWQQVHSGSRAARPLDSFKEVDSRHSSKTNPERTPGARSKWNNPCILF